MTSPTHVFRPDYSQSPGEYLREVLDGRGIKIVDFAKRCGRPTKTISEILAGDTAILPETAIQFEQVLGDIPASLWLGLESANQLAVAKQRGRQRFELDIPWMKRFPLSEMQTKGFIEKKSDPLDCVEALLTFFGVSSSGAWSEYWDQRVMGARFKQKANYTIDSYAVSAWLRKGDLDAAEVACAPYSEAEFRKALSEVRSLTRQRWPAPKARLVSLFSDAGVALVFVKDLSRTGLRGAAYWASKDKAVVIVSDRLKVERALWFAIFHECAHILIHSKKALFLDYGHRSEEDEEGEADEAAAQMLISSAQLREFYLEYGRRGGYSETQLRTYAKAIGIDPGLLLGRLQFEGVVAWGDRLTRVFNHSVEFD